MKAECWVMAKYSKNSCFDRDGEWPGHEPLIQYEDCLVEAKQKRWNLRLWTGELVDAERKGLKETNKVIKHIWSSVSETLPHLPPWGSPNGCDY